MTILWRLDGSPKNTLGYNPFKDVDSKAYYCQPVLWAYQHNIVAGKTKTTFDPNAPITRQELAAILWRYAGTPAANGSLAAVKDGNKASAYARPALSWAVAKGIMSGKGGGILDTAGRSTRAEAASMLMRYCED